MHGTIPPEKPTPEPTVKQRTITLTNRAPIKIIEDEWPVIAEGGCGEDWAGPEFGWGIEIRVRRHVDAGDWRKRHESRSGYIIHAHYVYNTDGDKDDQRVRVGRILTGKEGLLYLYKHILETGNELRERISNERFRKHVIYAVDQCFANLPPQDMSKMG
jgi:hypothetical protein